MYSFEFSLFFLLALICTGGILVFIYLKYQNSGESSKTTSEANGFESLPHDILHRIFALSEGPRELHRAGATCKAWRNASKSFIPFKSLEFKTDECDESSTQPQEDLFYAIDFQGDKPNAGVLKEDLISCSCGKDQGNTSSKLSGNVLRAAGINPTLPIPEAKLNLNQNVCALSDDVTLRPVEFLKTGGFVFDNTEEIRDQSIDDYVQDNPVVEPYVLYDKTEECICTNDGISLWLGFLTLLIVTFEAGKSWGGSFELQHLRMKNGKDCEINVPPACGGTFKNFLLDLAKLAELLIGFFSDKKHNTALYILELYKCMVNPKVGPNSSHQGQMRYLKYLRNHLAFSTSARRIALLKAIYQAFKSMVGEERWNFLKVLAQVMLTSCWKTIARGHKLLFKVLTFKRDHPNNKKVQYGATLKELLRFLRNLLEHGPEHTIENGQQRMENVEELDFIAATHFSNFIQDMLYSLVMELDMAGRLEIPWNNYCGCKE